jgi:hypothetical protein
MEVSSVALNPSGYETVIELNSRLGQCIPPFFEAIVWFEKTRSAVPAAPFTGSRLAANALEGETKPAAAELAEARRRSIDDRFSSIHRLKAPGSFGVATARAFYEATYFTGLRKAGMPEN